MLFLILAAVFGCVSGKESASDTGCVPGYRVDCDGDLFGSLSNDCDDHNAAVNPDAEEVCDNGIDDDCDDFADDLDADCQPVESQPPEDADGDGWTVSEGDCDDADASVHPGAEDLWYDGLDQDCDGASDFDQDGDGYDSMDYVGPDCDDSNAAVNPDAVEACDGIDNDCDGATDEDAADGLTWYQDADGDGYGNDLRPYVSCDQPSGYAFDNTDCNDLDGSVNPGALEECGDGIDNDCDAGTPDDAGARWYLDADADGYGDAVQTVLSCEQPVGYVTDASDCDDALASVHPGAPETCDGIDEDCDGAVDEDATDATAWYADVDGDGFGDAGVSTLSCDQPAGYGTDGTDCDDADAGVHPGAAEVCDGADQDCDGSADEGADDASFWYEDSDGDGFGDAADAVLSCDQPAGFVADGFDCDDADPAVYPDAIEVCDGIDNDCDGSVDEPDAMDAGTWYLDADGDGYGDATQAVISCQAPAGYVTDSTDCDDANATAYPGATEVCDGIDNDCNALTDELAADRGTWYADADGDGYGDPAVSALSCGQPVGYVTDGSDCDDADASLTPSDADEDGQSSCGGDCDDADAGSLLGGTEVCDGIDNDCDGIADDGLGSTYYFDLDGDGYGDPYASTIQACSAPAGYVTDRTDCNDHSIAVHPGAAETCDTLDDDCDGVADEDFDLDGDGFYAAVCPNGVDCDDQNAAANPSAPETCDGADNNCDGQEDEGYDADGDGYLDAALCPDGTDCDDADAGAHPGAAEVEIVSAAIVDRCSDTKDNDCDGAADLSDWDCLDDDGDGIRSGIDALVPFDADGDLDDDTLCVVALDTVMPSPWGTSDAVVQGDWTGGFSSLNASTYRVNLDPFADADGDGADETGAWCVDFGSALAPGSSGAWNGRIVSTLAADGVSAAPSTCASASPSTTWVSSDLAEFCAATGDVYCRVGYAAMDGCGEWLSGGIVRVRYTSTTRSIAPY